MPSRRRSSCTTTRVLHALRQVLVGRADEHPLDPRVGPGDRGRGGHRVVGFELEHRPDGHAERDEGVLEDRELHQQLGGHARTRLVARPQLVAERLDDLVGGHTDVGGPLLEHHEQRAHDAAHRGDLDAVVVEVRGHGEVVAEQLVCPVDEMDLHRGHDTPQGRGARAGRRTTISGVRLRE